MPDEHQTQSPLTPEPPAGPPNPPIRPSQPPTVSEPTPQFDSPVVTSQPKPAPDPSNTTPAATPPPAKKPLWLAIIVIVAAIFVYGLYYLPNTPERVYSASLTNTGQALDNLITYSRAQQQINYKSAAFTGAVKVKSPSGSFDVTAQGAGDKDGNAKMQFNADVLGQKATAEIRSIHASGNTTPDVYLQVNGIKSYLEANGLSSLASFDGQWIVVDHTLIDTYASQYKQTVAGTATDTTTAAPTRAQIQDAVDKVQAVNKQYIFTTDSSKAVLTNEKFVGQTTINGRSVNHYTVGYNKANLEAYLKAVGQALDNSQLNDWAKKMSGGKSISETMNVTQLQNDVKNAKSDYTFDLWADVKTKLISKISFSNPSDASSTFAISQGYTGGTSYPFTFTTTSKGAGSNPDTASLSLTADTKTNKVAITFSGDASTSEGGTTTVTANLTITPTNTAVNVTAPTGAKPVSDVLNALGLGSLLTPSSTKTETLPPYVPSALHLLR